MVESASARCPFHQVEISPAEAVLGDGQKRFTVRSLVERDAPVRIDDRRSWCGLRIEAFDFRSDVEILSARRKNVSRRARVRATRKYP